MGRPKIPLEVWCDRVVEILKTKPGGMTRTQIHRQVLRGNVPIDEVLEMLKGQGRIETETKTRTRTIHYEETHVRYREPPKTKGRPKP